MRDRHLAAHLGRFRVNVRAGLRTRAAPSCLNVRVALAGQQRATDAFGAPALSEVFRLNANAPPSPWKDWEGTLLEALITGVFSNYNIEATAQHATMAHLAVPLPF